MEFTLHTKFDDLLPLASEWDAMLPESMTDSPFLRFDYLRNWWNTLGGGEWEKAELALITAHESNRLVGAAPLFQAINRDGQPALLLLGSIEISDYLDVLVRPTDLPRFISGLLDFIANHGLKNWHVLDWYNLPEASQSLPALKTEAARRNWSFSQEIYQPAPYIPLPSDFEAYLAGIDKKQRHEIRRKLRRAAENEVPVSWHLVQDKASLKDEMEAFFELMIQDPAKQKFLTEPMRRQMLATAQTALRGGWLWLAFLEVGGRKAAGTFNFDYNNRLWGYNSAVNREFIELSPGWVLLAHTLQWACEHGRSEFDFMRGNEEYKYRFGGKDRLVMRVKLAR